MQEFVFSPQHNAEVRALALSALVIGGIVLGVFGVALFIRRWLLGRMLRFAKEYPASVAGVLYEDLKTPSLLWCMAAAVAALIKLTVLSADLRRLADNLLVAFLILSVTMVASSLFLRIIASYGERQNLPFVVAGLSRTLARGTIFAVGLLVLLHFLGIPITPVLTALGVGGLAVALALQDTLANLFAGVHILIERPIAVGDFIRLSADEEGTVTDVGWRTTRLLTSNNNTVVIPNKTVTSVNLVNYSMPDARVAVHVPIVLGLEADVRRAEKVALDAATRTEGVLQEPPPAFVADPGMQPTHLQFRLAFWVAQHVGSGLVRTRVVTRLLEGLRSEEIPMPDSGRLLAKG